MPPAPMPPAPPASPAAPPGAPPRWNPWLVGFIVWTLVGLLQALRHFVLVVMAREQASLVQVVMPNLLDAYLWGAATPLIFWLAHRYPFAPRLWLRAVPVHLLAASVITALILRVDFALWVAMEAPAKASFARFFASLYIWNLQWYAIVLGVALVLAHYRRARERELRASQLETQLVRAQLEALKMQIQPHFLFNTLHAISELVHEDQDAADRMISRLGDLLRLSIDAGATQEVALRDELEFLAAYLEIQQTRFQDRLRVSIAVPTELLTARVPNLVLQPLVENAIKHGTAVGTAPVAIAIAAAREGEQLRLEVRDNGGGLPRGAGPMREGVGLSNTRARLRQLYGAAQRLELHDAAGGGVVVVVTIPLRSQPQRQPAPAAVGVLEEVS